MNENNSPNPGDVAPGSDAHEALIRRQAAAQMLAYGDRARALGIDIDDVAAGLMAAADEWQLDDELEPPTSVADLGDRLGMAGCPRYVIEILARELTAGPIVVRDGEPTMYGAWCQATVRRIGI